MRALAFSGRNFKEISRDPLTFAFGMLLPVILIRPEVESGQLLPVLPDWEAPPTEIGAVYPSRRGLSPKVRVFIDFLSERLAHLSGSRRG